MKSLTAIATLLCVSPSLADTLIVDLYSTSFSPDVVNVVPGDVVRFQYVTGYPHTATSGTPCTPDGLYFDESLNSPGDYFEWTVPDGGPDEIPFFCTPHCNFGMTGVIIISPACPADLNNDGVVDVVDLLEVVGSWGESDVPSDINGDGVVNVSDLLAVVDAWGSC